MGQCWSGIISNIRMRRDYHQRDGFLIEMQSMNFDDFDGGQHSNMFKWADPSSHVNFLGNQNHTLEYFTLDGETNSTEDSTESPLRSFRSSEILNPEHLYRNRNLDNRKPSFPWNQQFNRISSKDGSGVYTTLQNCSHGSVPSIDLEWENEECLDITASSKVQSNIHYINLEENGNKPIVRWTSSKQFGDTQSSSKVSLNTEKRSRASSESSLVWDNDNQQICSAYEPHSILDQETENLLSEIEELTSTALKETAQWTTLTEQSQTSAMGSVTEMSISTKTVDSSTGSGGSLSFSKADHQHPLMSADRLKTTSSSGSQSVRSLEQAGSDDVSALSGNVSDLMISSIDTDSPV